MAIAGYEIEYDAVRAELTPHDLEQLIRDKWLTIPLRLGGGASSIRINIAPPRPDFTDFDKSG